jgi:hypothetical protein
VRQENETEENDLNDRFFKPCKDEGAAAERDVLRDGGRAAHRRGSASKRGRKSGEPSDEERRMMFECSKVASQWGGRMRREREGERDRGETKAKKRA